MCKAFCSGTALTEVVRQVEGKTRWLGRFETIDVDSVHGWSALLAVESDRSLLGSLVLALRGLAGGILYRFNGLQ